MSMISKLKTLAGWTIALLVASGVVWGIAHTEPSQDPGNEPPSLIILSPEVSPEPVHYRLYNHADRPRCSMTLVDGVGLVTAAHCISNNGRITSLNQLTYSARKNGEGPAIPLILESVDWGSDQAIFSSRLTGGSPYTCRLPAQQEPVKVVGWYGSANGTGISRGEIIIPSTEGGSFSWFSRPYSVASYVATGGVSGGGVFTRGRALIGVHSGGSSRGLSVFSPLASNPRICSKEVS